MKKLLALMLIGIMTLTTFVGCATNEAQPQPESEAQSQSSAPQDEEQELEPSGSGTASQDAMLPMIAIYGGKNYLMTENILTDVQGVLGKKLGDSSGFIDFSSNFDENLLSTDLANSFSEDAVFYSMEGYDEAFRIIIESGDTYYVCESTQAAASDIVNYFDRVYGGLISSHMGLSDYAELTAEETLKLLDIFSKATKAELTNDDYQNIATAQTEGKSYRLKVIFDDDTFTTIYVIPELNLVSIGQEYYTSQTLADDIADYFAELPQTPDEVVN